MSLCPFSSSTSNIAFGRAWATTASITTAASFWSPSSRSVLRTFGVRGPRRGPFDFPKTREVYLLGGRGRLEAGLDGRRNFCRHELDGDKAAQRLEPAAVLPQDFGEQGASAVEVARSGQTDCSHESDLDQLRPDGERLLELLCCRGSIAGRLEVVRVAGRHVGSLDSEQPPQL